MNERRMGGGFQGLGGDDRFGTRRRGKVVALLPDEGADEGE